MTSSLTLGCLWVLAAAMTAMLPMRRQLVPGLALLIAAPGLLGWIGWQHGVLVFALTTLAALSVFRKPLFHLARRLTGAPGEAP